LIPALLLQLDLIVIYGLMMFLPKLNRPAGTLEVQGRDVLAELDEIRDALMLIKRDVDMEAKYPKLKELKDEYAKQLAKYATFDTIKESK